MIIALKKVGLIILTAVILAAGASLLMKTMNSGSGRPVQPVTGVSSPVVAGQSGFSGLVAGDKFFAEYRMDRERMRGKQVEMLQEILIRNSSDKEARQAVSLRLVEISADMEREMKAESLIKSQGYQDCVIIIQPDSATVVVAAGYLQLGQEKEIAALVSRAVKLREDQVVIIVRDAEKNQ